MSSVKISELNDILAVTGDDYLPIVDSGSNTTYRTSIDLLTGWIAASGSVISSSYALTSSYANTASYAVSASWSDDSLSASYATTASYYDVTSFVPEHAVSASYAETASCLQGKGTSVEQTLELSTSLVMATSASIRLGRKLSSDPLDEPLDRNSIYFNKDYGTDLTVNDWARIYFTEPLADFGKVVFELGDEIDPDELVPEGPALNIIKTENGGFLWGAVHSAAMPYSTASLMFLADHGVLYLRSAEARNFSQSLENQVGFYGTASCAVSSSHALTASYFNSSTSGGETENFAVEVSETSTIELSDYTIRQLQVDHGLSGKPDVIVWEYVCKNAIAGFSVGDALPICAVKVHRRDDDWDYWLDWATPYSNATVGGLVFCTNEFYSAGGGQLIFFNKTTADKPTETVFSPSDWYIRGRFIRFNNPTAVYPGNYLKDGVSITPGTYSQFRLIMNVRDDGEVEVGATYTYTSVTRGGAGVAEFNKSKAGIPNGTNSSIYLCLESDATNFVLSAYYGGIIVSGPSSTGTACTPA